MWEVEELCTAEELDEWVAIFSIDSEDIKRERNKSKSKGGFSIRR